MKLSVIAPCYNEQENVKTFYDKLKKELKNIKFEVIFVDDGSIDKTLIELKNIKKYNKKRNIKIISFSRNFGKEAAIFAGLQNACGEFTALIDVDLQQNPKYIVEMMNILENNKEFDQVAAYQNKRREFFIMNILKACFYKLINSLSDITFINKASDFRVLRRNVLNSVLMLSEYNRFSKGIFSFVGFNTYYMSYDVEKRKYGKTKWNFIKLLKYSIDGIVSFSIKPLRFATFTGIITSIASIIYLTIVIFQKIVNSISPPGYTTIVVLVLFLGGIQLFSIGIIGE